MGIRISATRTLRATGLSLSSARYIAVWVRSASAGSVGGAHKLIATVGAYGTEEFGLFSFAGYNEGTAFARRTASSSYSQKTSGSSLPSSWAPLVVRITISTTVTEVAVRQSASAWLTVAATVPDISSAFTALILGGNQEVDVGEVWVYSAFSDADWAAFRDKTALPESLGTVVSGASLLDLSSGLGLSGGGTLVDTGTGTALVLTDTHPITRSPPAGFSAGATLGSVVASGSLASVMSGFTSGATLGAVVAGGNLGQTPGTFVLGPIIVNGVPQAGAALDWVRIYSDGGVLLYERTGGTLNGSGSTTLTTNAAPPGTAVRIDWQLSGGRRRMPRVTMG